MTLATKTSDELEDVFVDDENLARLSTLLFTQLGRTHTD
jgi:hypothetical protein